MNWKCLLGHEWERISYCVEYSPIGHKLAQTLILSTCKRCPRMKEEIFKGHFKIPGIERITDER